MIKKYLGLFLLAFLLLLNTGCSQEQKSSAVNALPNPSESSQPPYVAPPDPFMMRIGESSKQAIKYKEPDSMMVLVNKQNPLPSDYIPQDLVEVNIPFSFKEKSDKSMMRQDAAANLEKLFRHALDNQIVLYGVSGYRSYQTQKDLFQYFTARDGSPEKANQISARPGESEHQSGLAMDISSQSVSYGLVQYFEDTKEYAWLKDNAHFYGFIIRYPKGKELLTEYVFEPWHLRYVGVETATILYQENLTLEEYLFFRI